VSYSWLTSSSSSSSRLTSMAGVGVLWAIGLDGFDPEVLDRPVVGLSLFDGGSA
jgi:hypothetical protein